MRPIYLHCIQEKLTNMARSEDLRGCVQTTNSAKKASTKSLLIISKNGAKLLSRRMMEKKIYGAKKGKKVNGFGAKRGTLSSPVERLVKSQIIRIAHKL